MKAYERLQAAKVVGKKFELVVGNVEIEQMATMDQGEWKLSESTPRQIQHFQPLRNRNHKY